MDISLEGRHDGSVPWHDMPGDVRMKTGRSSGLWIGQRNEGLRTEAVVTARQSIPSNRASNCTLVSVTGPACGFGQVNRPGHPLQRQSCGRAGPARIAWRSRCVCPAARAGPGEARAAWRSRRPSRPGPSWFGPRLPSRRPRSRPAAGLLFSGPVSGCPGLLRHVIAPGVGMFPQETARRPLPNRPAARAPRKARRRRASPECEREFAPRSATLSEYAAGEGSPSGGIRLK